MRRNTTPMLTVERVDAERDTWTVGRWSPAPSDSLFGFVEGIFYWDGLPDRPYERVFPNGRISLIVQLDDCYRPGGGRPPTPFSPLCVDGLWTTSFVVEAPPRRARVIGVTLTPVGAVKILDNALRGLNGGTSDLKDVVGKAARELGERVSSAGSVRGAVTNTVAWLRTRLHQFREIAPEIVWIVTTIEASNGCAPVRELIASVSNSPSRLSGSFVDHFGLSPKRFARLVRFRRTIDLLSAASGSFADVATLAGYYDQAHFNAEFKLHAGMTPSAFLAASRYPGSASLAEGDWDVFSNTAAPLER